MCVCSFAGHVIPHRSQMYNPKSTPFLFLPHPLYRVLKKFRAPLKTLLFLPLNSCCVSSVSIPAGCFCSDLLFIFRPKLPPLPRGSGGLSLTKRALSDPIKLAALSLATTPCRPIPVEPQFAGTGREDVDGDRRRRDVCWSSPPPPPSVPLSNSNLSRTSRTPSSSSSSSSTDCLASLQPTRVDWEPSHDRLALLLVSRVNDRFSLSTKRLWNLLRLP